MKLHGNCTHRHTLQPIGRDGFDNRRRIKNLSIRRHAETVWRIFRLSRQRLKLNRRLRFIGGRLAYTGQRGHGIKEPPHAAGWHSVKAGGKLALKNAPFGWRGSGDRRQCLIPFYARGPQMRQCRAAWLFNRRIAPRQWNVTQVGASTKILVIG